MSSSVITSRQSIHSNGLDVKRDGTDRNVQPMLSVKTKGSRSKARKVDLTYTDKVNVLEEKNVVCLCEQD